ncbi:MAG: PilZ domain-containing protein [Candidatus Omnitrophica bacterium]|nr:PilZ domain-containing protein [Candidatus Omnitrophota bacterium]
MFKFFRPKKEEIKENRAYTRAKVYYLVKIQKPGESREKMVLTSLKNLSAGGACIKLQESLPVSSTLCLSINYPGSDKPVFAVGKIDWVRKLDKDKGYEAGLSFIEIEDAMRQEIARNIDFATKKLKELE